MQLVPKAATALVAQLFATGIKAALYEQIIETKYGPVQGVAAFNSTSGPSANISNWDEITTFKGIPFAASTAGENRWKPPQPPVAWNDTLIADSFGPECPSGISIAGTYVSEDCLTVNIWTPANSTGAKLPVMIWSYGAGTTSSDDNYDGGGIAAKGVIFISYNYRTGPWGWLSLPELTAESSTNSSGNYGLMDQIQIFKWAKENVAAFGGDPDSITAVGQSFGSAAVYHLINSPQAKGLFKGAICESGIKDPYDPTMSGFANSYMNQSYSYTFSETYASSLNATTVAELRNLTTDVLATGTGVSDFSGFQPTLDGYYIPTTYYESLLNGPVNDVPLLAGNNKDEDGATPTVNTTVEAYEEATNSTYGPYAAALLDLYDGSTNDTAADDATNARARDIARISTWSFAQRWNKTASSPMYVYYWDHDLPGSDDGAGHASEISYVLSNLYAVTSTPWATADYLIADIMSSYWVNFIKTGNPNTGGTYSGDLAGWRPQTELTTNTSFHVGPDDPNLYGQVPIADPQQVQTLYEWFHWATPNPW
ncbi:alpha/beta-hydrolase [Cryphonectria parasitica EP155]|uniref:Alpha/beta-hydrolase n=1 Tax=Cryphonectria parasitica (strain ATCC 38755 / EP155) TaxID=660469 RepID=A0A9P5CLP1_CRYP1|nr:alpha/beta-hydrolase [Cryphonectria parasitica EP155]KAF3762035.1 alpha/beta-hydrolase [Cryphonectria parasitica EP155]